MAGCGRFLTLCQEKLARSWQAFVLDRYRAVAAAGQIELDD